VRTILVGGGLENRYIEIESESCSVESQVGVVILGSIWSVLSCGEDDVTRMTVQSFRNYPMVIPSAFPSVPTSVRPV